MSRHDQAYHVYVAALTRRRPDMAAELLDSLLALQLPENCKVTFLLVENDSTPQTRALVESKQHLVREACLRYCLETEPGIPFGRNRAAKEAIADGADLLLFIDDDEVVAPDWLVKMINAYRRSDKVLLGAPLRAIAPKQPLSAIQSIMLKNVRRRYAIKEQRAAKLANAGRDSNITIVTNNWLADLRIFTQHNIWFDEKMRFTGGTDAKFYTEVQEAGLPTGWVTDAFVYETVPPERLSFWYQYKRARDQSNTHVCRKLESRQRSAVMALLPVPAKTAILFMQLIAVPLTAGKTLLSAARTMGWISGRIGYLFGKRSALYTEITGS